MRFTRLISTLTMTAFLAASTATPARAEPTAAVLRSGTPTPTPLRASIDRAVASADATGFPPVSQRRPASPRRMQYGNGGGGGGGMMLFALVSAAIGLAGTIYLTRMMTKETEKATSGQ